MTRSRSSFLFEFLVFFRLAVTIMPIVDHYSNSLMNIGTFLLLYVYLVFGMGVSRFGKGFIANVPVFLISILSIISLFIRDKQVIGFIYELFIFMQWPLIYVYLAYRKDMNLVKRILVYALVCYLSTCITTYVGCTVFEGAARHMSNSNFAEINPDLMSLYRSFNIGTFTFIYSLVIVSPMLIGVFRNQKGVAKIVGLISMVIVVAVIIKTEYTTALLLLLSSFILFFLPKDFSRKNLFSVLAIAVVVLIISAPLLQWLMDTISSMVNSDQVADRLGSIVDLQAGKEADSDSDLGQRIELWTESLDIFLSHILFGFSGDNGGHSFILDNLARFGLIGLFSEFVVFGMMHRRSAKPFFGTALYGYAVYALILNVIQCLVNPVINYFAFTFIIPLTCLYFSQSSELSRTNEIA